MQADHPEVGFIEEPSVDGEQEAFEEVVDNVKINRRKEITEALNLAKSTAVWSETTDKRNGVCGTLSENCVRTRRECDDPCLPSVAMIQAFPALSSSSVNVVTPTTEFTSFTTVESSITWEGVRLFLPTSCSIYGMGENAGGLLLNEMTEYKAHEHSGKYDKRRQMEESSSVRYPRPRNNTICWNTDACFYDESFESLYQSHPWVLAVYQNGTALGVFCDTTYRTIIHLCKDECERISLYFLSEGPKGAPPVYLFPAETPQGVIKELCEWTGKMELPPLWALGYQQCRYSYYPDSTVRAIAKGFRDRQIPCDVIWMDIHYMNEYRCFTFDSEHFPDPKELNEHLHSMGFKSVWMIDPGIKYEKGYPVFDSGTAGNHWISSREGSNNPAIGKVWPGRTVFPDFCQEKTRKWWAGLFEDYMAHGIDGVWNDMNEIASFQEGGTIPQESYHHADESLGGPDSNRRYHNVYGMLMTKASRDGIQKANPTKRPFVLTRANFMGGQRYAACWTGDNTSSWKHLHFSIPMVLNMGLSAQPFVGVDIGGFFENASPDLYARWVGLGALLPFARGHSCIGTHDHEPWSFGEKTENTCKQAIERRYRLIQYIYTAFWESSNCGLPVAQPLFFVDPSDVSLRDVDDAFMIGTDLLVRCYTTPEPFESWELPRKYRWSKVTLLDEKEATDPNLPLLYQREGSIIPIGPVVQSTSELKGNESLELLVFLNEQGTARGQLYEDAGDGYEYKTDQYILNEFTAYKNEDRVIVTVAVRAGKMAKRVREYKIRLLELEYETELIIQ